MYLVLSVFNSLFLNLAIAYKYLLTYLRDGILCE